LKTTALFRTLMPMLLGIACGSCGLVFRDVDRSRPMMNGQSAKYQEKLGEEPGYCEVLWKQPGDWWGVACDDASGAIYAGQSFQPSRIVCFDEQGVKGATVKISDQHVAPFQLRLADLEGDSAPEFVLFGHWGSCVEAFARDGNTLWHHAMSNGTNDVRTTRGRGDAKSDVLIGGNADGGVRVLAADGRVKWMRPDLGNAWSLRACEAAGSSAYRVVVDSAGTLHMLDHEGADIGVLRSPERFSRSVGSVTPEGGIRAICVRGTSRWNIWEPELQFRVFAIASQRGVLWSTTVLDVPRYYIMAVERAAGSEWLACALRNGLILIFNAESGRLVATMNAGSNPMIAWLERGDRGSPLLLIASDDGLSAVRVHATRESGGTSAK
jgi:hypothetical protein